jgi:hypothetical protein
MERSSQLPRTPGERVLIPVHDGMRKRFATSQITDA